MKVIKKVISAVSGGIDSAVSTYLLKSKGYEVVGVFMQNWDLLNEKGVCTAQNDIADAEWICNKLEIPFHVVNFVKEYWIEVFSNLVDDYKSGWTPNPDIICNKRIKFDAFLKYAFEDQEADCISTGHYAQTSFGSYLEKYDADKGVHLLEAKDSLKDQTFFLSQISQNALQRTMFPIGCMRKLDVKKLAESINLNQILKKKESMGICFIGSRNFQDFISEYVTARPGNFIDIESGLIVGRHEGIHHWTVGQRCRIGGVRIPYFVVEKDTKNQDILVAPGTDHPALYTDLVFTDRPHWIHSVPLPLEVDGLFDCYFRFQHTHRLLQCRICSTAAGRLVVRLSKPLRAITPGQYAVFYLNEECLGSARIIHPGPSQFMSEPLKSETYIMQLMK